jgi:uncharacterized protein
MSAIADTHTVVDVDSHITEPPDLWTSRVSTRWGDLVPHVARDPKSGRERWFVGETKLPSVASTALAGWSEFPPSHPPTLAEADPAAWRNKERLQRMDEYGLAVQLLYPNILGFQSALFISLGEKELANACVAAYNDFLAEFCSIAPTRLVPLMMLPYWDMEATLAELKRAKNLGHKGIVFGANFQAVGLPGIADEYWNPLYESAQELELSLNFHIGISAKTLEDMRAMQRTIIGNKEAYVKESALMMLGNANSIADLTLGGVCERFPHLKFVSVESGATWLPFVLQSFDWQWLNSGAHDAMPDRLMPSEYFRRQIYGSFWFESDLLDETLQLYEDNFMFETDFPHPTSLSPGPASYSPHPREVLDRLGKLPERVLTKVLTSTAVKVYGLELPDGRNASQNGGV